MQQRFCELRLVISRRLSSPILNQLVFPMVSRRSTSHALAQVKVLEDRELPFSRLTPRIPPNWYSTPACIPRRCLVQHRIIAAPSSSIASAVRHCLISP
jgi:hypothetical protein